MMTPEQKAAAAAVVAQQSAAAVAAAQAAAAPPISDHLKHARGTVDKTVEKDEGDDTAPLEIWGNETTYNVNPILHTNICQSDYFKNLCKDVKTFPRLLDEIYNEVNHLEPFTAGSQRMPSTAFCILFRAFTMRLTTKQLTTMLNHSDSPFIRCVALLYLRYTCEPKELWSWFEPLTEDQEKIKAGRMINEEPISVANYTLKLLTEQNYYDTIFPRIPVPVYRSIQNKLIEKRTGKKVDSGGPEHKVGDIVKAQWGDGINTGDGEWYDVARIDEVIDGGKKYLVTFVEYGNQDECTPDQIKIKNKYGAKKKRDESPGRDGKRAKDRSRSPDDDVIAKVLAQEREKACAAGKDYARRPTSYKTALSLQVSHGTNRRRSSDDHHGSWNSEG